jgi:hypothetical protein
MAALDGRPMTDVARELIKPNDRLTSVERLAIYARCYWYRLIDCVYDDAPGLRALLGEKRFSALVRGYLAKYPSQSYTLRNLCSRLAPFIAEEPGWTAPHTALAHAVARFEWAQTVAFDGEARPVLTRDDLADSPPARLRLALQPYISLLALDWAVDDFVIAVKNRDALRADASHTPDQERRHAKVKRAPRPRRQRVHVVVHRFENRIYYKRVEPAAFTMLEALHAGRPLASAIALAGSHVKPEQVRGWFATWMELGWFCRRRANSGK